MTESRFNPFMRRDIEEEGYASLPELPQGVVDRLKAVMELWHKDPHKASWFIDPKIAKAMWGESRAQKVAAPVVKDSTDETIKRMWLTNPERAVRFVKPTQAIKKYGKPEGITWRRLVELSAMHERLRTEGLAVSGFIDEEAKEEETAATPG